MKKIQLQVTNPEKQIQMLMSMLMPMLTSMLMLTTLTPMPTLMLMLMSKPKPMPPLTQPTIGYGEEESSAISTKQIARKLIGLNPLLPESKELISLKLKN
jgi:hypothetical protein